MKTLQSFFILLIFVALISLTGCSSQTKTPKASNLCHLFLKTPRWLWAAEKAEHRWRVPMSLLMAVIYQESHFRRGAAPKRTKLFNSIPWLRPTSAEGFAQATNETWRVYCRNRQRFSANRDDFSDAVDFVAWYVSYAHQKLRIAKNDPYRAYLAYHEGITGYKRKSYRAKFWLRIVARKVRRRSYRYHRQLVQCLHTLPKKPWWYS